MVPPANEEATGGEVVVQRWFAITRCLAGVAVATALLTFCAPLDAALAGSTVTLVASLASNPSPTEASTTRLPKWQRVRDWLANDGGASDPALADRAAWAASQRDRPPIERLTEINNRVNRTIRYATDMEVWGVADYWETPSEAVAKRATDCEGSAILKYWLARMAGIPDDALSMMVGIIGSTRQMHAVLSAGVADRGYVLDVRMPYVLDLATFGDFRLLVSVDLQEIEIFAGGFGGAQPAPAALSSN